MPKKIDSKIKPVTNKVINQQRIKALAFDTDNETIVVTVEFSRTTSMPIDNEHSTPWEHVDNIVNRNIILSTFDVETELETLIATIDLLV